MRPRIRTYTDILAQQMATMRVRSGINLPLNDGDAFKAALEAASLADCDQFVQMVRVAKELTLAGSEKERIDERMAELGASRLLSAKATMPGHFRRVPGTAGLINILAGTTVLIPATPTTSAVEFVTTGATTIGALDNDSPDITVEAVQAGSRSNGVASSTSLDLKSTISNVQDFFSTGVSGGGLDREEDDKAKARTSLSLQELARATATSVEAAVARVTVAGGGAVTAYKVIENFRTGVTEVYVDDGTGDAATIGPTIPAQIYRYTALGGEIYVRAEQLIGLSGGGGSREDLPCGFPLITLSLVERDPSPYGAPAAQVLGTDYWVDLENGILAFNVPLSALERVNITTTTYGGLVEETAKVIRGLPGNPSYPGYRAANAPYKYRPPSTNTVATVAGALTVASGYNGAFSRSLAAANILKYINNTPVGAPARYARMIDIAMDSPGAENFVLTTPTGDIAPASETGTVRATTGTVTVS